MKRLSIALAAIGISASALAAYPAATDPTIVNVPLLPGGFFVGGTAYYLETTPSNGDLDYASVNSGTSSAFFSTLKELEPGYDGAWAINVGYVFPYTGNDINVSYFQMDTNENDHIGDISSSPVIGFIFPVTNEITGFGTFGPFSLAFANVEYDINQVDATLGQYINIGCRLITHPFIGLRWSHIDRDLSTSLLGTSSALITAPFFTTREQSDFDGFGPIVGIDASYYIYSGFGAVGHFDSALLVGDINTETDTNFGVFVTPIVPIISNLFEFRSDDENYRIVPVMDAKLGVNYTYVLNNYEYSDVTFEMGWQFSRYFNLVDRLNTLNTVSISGSNEFTIFGRRTSNIGLQGPYATLTFHA